MSNVKQSISKLVPLLERLALLRINQDAFDRVVKCVEFSSIIDQVDASQLENVEPMISPCENQCVFMRDDCSYPTDRNEITRNASRLMEDYFVTPMKHKHYRDL